jgi:hypothetical protein
MPPPAEPPLTSHIAFGRTYYLPNYILLLGVEFGIDPPPPRTIAEKGESVATHANHADICCRATVCGFGASGTLHKDTRDNGRHTGVPRGRKFLAVEVEPRISVVRRRHTVTTDMVISIKFVMCAFYVFLEFTRGIGASGRRRAKCLAMDTAPWGSDAVSVVRIRKKAPGPLICGWMTLISARIPLR